jgi:hypothetical protein
MRQNELNDKEELEALAEIIKEVITKITKRHIVIKARTTKKLADKSYF